MANVSCGAGVRVRRHRKGTFAAMLAERRLIAEHLSFNWRALCRSSGR